MACERLDVPVGWVHLGPRVRGDTLKVMDSVVPNGTLRARMSEAGLQYRMLGGDRVVVRASPGVGNALYILPLQRQDGAFRSDASERLMRDSGNAIFGDLTDMAASMPGTNLDEDLNLWAKAQFELADAFNPLEVLRRWHAHEPRLRFFRLGATRSFAGRVMLLRWFEAIMEGEEPSVGPVRQDPNEGELTEGLLQVGPAPFLGPALMARFQPLTAVLFTIHGVQVAVTPTDGYLLRPLQPAQWQVGMNFPSLRGPGAGMYPGGEPPRGWPSEMLDVTVGAASRLVEYLTDPGLWRTPADRYDYKSRRVTYASVLFGLEAVGSMASNWQAPSAVWDAFRALGTLQGVWEARRQGALRLQDLLHPNKIRDYAVSALGDAEHRQWAAGVVDNYEAELRRLDPDDDAIDALVTRLAEVRHLHHGVYAQGANQSMMNRYDALQALEKSQLNTQFVCDIAAIWWSAVIFDCQRLCKPGVAPWENQPSTH